MECLGYDMGFMRSLGGASRAGLAVVQALAETGSGPGSGTRELRMS